MHSVCSVFHFPHLDAHCPPRPLFYLRFDRNTPRNDAPPRASRSAPSMERLALLLDTSVAHGLIPQRRIGAIKKMIRSGKRSVRWFVERWEKKLQVAGITAAAAAAAAGSGRYVDKGTDEADRYGDAGERAAFMTTAGASNRAWKYFDYDGDPAWGQCDVESVLSGDVTRAWLLARTTPVVIKGATKGWPAFEKWSRDSLLSSYGEDTFYPRGVPGVNKTLAEVLKYKPYGGAKYHMGHLKRRGACYRGDMEPYSPFLGLRAGDDFDVPSYVLPAGMLLMGIGEGASGLGVPPEAHHMSWLAHVQGRKRWIVHPPNVQAPKASMARGPHAGGCVPRIVAQGALRCDAEIGDILWLPSFWWHETCGLDDFNVPVDLPFVETQCVLGMACAAQLFCTVAECSCLALRRRFSGTSGVSQRTRCEAAASPALRSKCTVWRTSTDAKVASLPDRRVRQSTTSKARVAFYGTI